MIRSIVTAHRIRCAALVAALVSLFVVGRATLPSIGHGAASIDGRPLPSGDVPVSVATKDPRRLEVTFPIAAPFFRPTQLVLVPDDELEAVSVDGVPVDVSGRRCGRSGCVVRLPAPGARGNLDVDVHVGNRKVRAGLDASVRSAWPFALFGLATVGCAGLLLFLVVRRRPGWGPDHTAVFGVLVVAAVVRTLYLLGTPPTVRAHDGDKHYDYIRYLAEHWSLPPPHAGFEFYQPPLYYALMAPILAVETRLGVVLTDTMFHLQLASVALSMVAIAIALTTLRALLAARADGPAAGDLVLGGALLALFPSLVFFAPRINNDVLVQVTSFGGVALALSFWRDGRPRTWTAFAACAAAGLLCKSNTYVVIAFGLFCLLARRGLAWRDKLRMVGVFTAVVGVGAGWFVVRRVLQERGASGLLVSNVSWLSHDARVPNAFGPLFTLNPVRVLVHPYNWPPDGAPGRPFWEYFVRSALFGEFDLGARTVWLGRAMLLLATLLVALAIRGWWRSARDRPWQDLPVHALLFGSLASHFAFRVASPYAPSQDFRYSFLLVLPFAYFVPLGMRGLPRGVREGALAVWGAFTGCSVALVVSLWMIVVP